MFLEVSVRPLLAVVIVTLFISLSSVSAGAKTPPEILEPYKAYRAALDAGEHDLARRSAQRAWELAEDLLGESKMTGDLAFNYGSIIDDGKAERNQIKAIQRSMELVAGYDDLAASMYLQRGIELTLVMDRAGKSTGIASAARDLVKFAEKNGELNSTFYAEALTILAGKRASRGKNKDAKELTEKAIAVFERADDGILSAYPLQAALYQGYAYEGEDDHFKAALNYQKVMEATDGIDPAKVELVGETLGRWIHMRNALRTSGQLEEAEQAGLCQCWPYDKPRSEDVQPIKRVPPVMPRIAQQSGYVVVEFDLNDAGSPINERVIAAWPDYFEKPAVKSLRDWEYTARLPDQTDEDREDLIATITFRLADQKGDIIW